MGELTFITRPVRSGKSQRAVELAKRWGSDTVFVATYQNETLGEEARARDESDLIPRWEFFDKSARDAGTLTKMDVQIAGE
jgi:adenosylcobinamide kinase / adenosylcobinamide-phosphate guanylyltransferase